MEQLEFDPDKSKFYLHLKASLDSIDDFVGSTAFEGCC
jgi:hypothetical protein